ncbi:MAG: glycosyltransferase family 4 protein [Armatimonadota bacterium]
MASTDATRLLHLLRPSIGGMREHVISLTGALSEDNYDVMVAGALDAELRKRLSRARVRYANIGFPATWRIRENLNAAAAVARLLNSQQPDICHAHGYHAGLLASLAVDRADPRPRLICTAHNMPFSTPRGLRARLAERLAYRRLLSRADATIAVSEAVKEELCRLAPRVRDRCRAIYNGINAHKFDVVIDAGLKKEQLGLSPPAAVVGYVGRLSREKGVYVFMDAAVRLSHALPNVEFLVVGAGPELDRMKREAHRRGIYGTIVFAGFRDDIPGILPVLDVVAIPSLSEGFSMVAAEALAAGTPVVASDTGGLVEILGEAPGAVLVPPGDGLALARGLAEVLRRVPQQAVASAASEFVQTETGERVRALVSEESYELSDRDDWRRSHGAGRSEVSPSQAYVRRRFSVERMVAATKAAYDELLAQR